MTHIRHALVALIILVVAAVVGQAPAIAQTSAITGMHFKTEFPFVVSTMKFPAGSYTVRQVTGNPRLLRISNDTTQKAVLVAANESLPPNDAPFPTGARFEHRDAGYLLSTLWDAPAHAAVNLVIPPNQQRKGTVTVAPPTFRVIPATKDQ